MSPGVDQRLRFSNRGLELTPLDDGLERFVGIISLLSRCEDRAADLDEELDRPAVLRLSSLEEVDLLVSRARPNAPEQSVLHEDRLIDELAPSLAKMGDQNGVPAKGLGLREVVRRHLRPNAGELENPLGRDIVRRIAQSQSSERHQAIEDPDEVRGRALAWRLTKPVERTLMRVVRWADECVELAKLLCRQVRNRPAVDLLFSFVADARNQTLEHGDPRQENPETAEVLGKGHDED